MSATAGGIIARIFVVSRALAMLTDMRPNPHIHLGMPGGIQKKALAYTAILALLLALFFDVSRIAAMGIII
jgi:hypothetical protein